MIDDKLDNVAKIQFSISLFVLLALIGTVLGIMAYHHTL